MEEIRQGLVDKYCFHVSSKGWMSITENGKDDEVLHLNEENTKEIVEWLYSILRLPSIIAHFDKQPSKQIDPAFAIDSRPLPARDELASRKASGKIPEADPFKVPADSSADGKQRILGVETIDLAALARKNGIPLP